MPEDKDDDYSIVERKDGTYLVDAQIQFYDFLTRFEKTDWMYEGEMEFDTLAGFILYELKHIPQAGEKLELGSPILTFFVRGASVTSCNDSLREIARDLDHRLFHR